METNFFANYLERLENLQRNIRNEIQDLPQEAIDWVPGPEMNPTGVLLAHIAGSLRYWIGDVALGDSSGRIRESEFKTYGLSAVELLRRMEAVIDYARGALPRLRLSDLEQKRRTEEGEEVACGWALLHALEHGYLHLGHLQLTTQLWAEHARGHHPGAQE
ncbi:MAG: DinB family protein [Chloroflexi bacterium]|nr:DinB family protein [Chloroflexota bacterium]